MLKQLQIVLYAHEHKTLIMSHYSGAIERFVYRSVYSIPQMRFNSHRRIDHLFVEQLKTEGQ